ncbi:hypothetical protein CASFOL_021310 [Castilleja foliolosa]|uniref:F-box domain-containing protein n=1 Tax=Castilleja foliolosa TaxID=1961234 RepID=A0ABD3CZM7_9LAMI
MGKRRGKKKSHRKRHNNPTAGGSSSSAPPPWIELPRDVTENILSRLGPVEILENAQKVCTTWRSVCNEPSLWRVIEMKSSDYGSLCRLTRMYRHAVDLSQGELIDVNIKFLCPDDLLQYISERSSRLKSLRLRVCHKVSSKCLTTAVSKFPELEVLHIFYLSFYVHMPLFITAKEIEAIGISCPKLKSFAFNISCDKRELLEIDENYALSIAKNMPNLHHLCLDMETVSREGVKAIFNGCPNLESLILRDCLVFYSDNQSSGINSIVVSRGSEAYGYW